MLASNSDFEQVSKALEALEKVSFFLYKYILLHILFLYGFYSFYSSSYVLFDAEKILIVGEGKDADENPYAVLFQQAGGLERFGIHLLHVSLYILFLSLLFLIPMLDLLQFHNNTHIYDKSNEILWKYFKVSNPQNKLN